MVLACRQGEAGLGGGMDESDVAEVIDIVLSRDAEARVAKDTKSPSPREAGTQTAVATPVSSSSSGSETKLSSSSSSSSGSETRFSSPPVYDEEDEGENTVGFPIQRDVVMTTTTGQKKPEWGRFLETLQNYIEHAVGPVLSNVGLQGAETMEEYDKIFATCAASVLAPLLDEILDLQEGRDVEFPSSSPQSPEPQTGMLHRRYCRALARCVGRDAAIQMLHARSLSTNSITTATPLDAIVNSLWQDVIDAQQQVTKKKKSRSCRCFGWINTKVCVCGGPSAPPILTPSLVPRRIHFSSQSPIPGSPEDQEVSDILMGLNSNPPDPSPRKRSRSSNEVSTDRSPKSRRLPIA